MHKAFDVFVMSSVTEGLGTSLLDAMACARPVVATSVGGIPEVVVDGETGLLVPPRDPEALGAAIARLISDRGLREKMGAAGLERVETFSAEHMVGIRSGVQRRANAPTPSPSPSTPNQVQQARELSWALDVECLGLGAGLTRRSLSTPESAADTRISDADSRRT